MAAAADGFLEVFVEPVVVDVPEPSMQGKRHWKILASPPPTVIAAEPFRSRLQQEVDEAFRAEHPWIANLRSQWSLAARLDQALKAARLQFTRAARADDQLAGRPVNHFLPPPEGAGPAHLFIPFTYTLTEMSRLWIEAASAIDSTATDLAGQEQVLPPDLRELLPADRREAMAARIGFRLRGREREFAPGERERLLKVARHAFTVALGQNALPPQPVVDDSTREKVVLLLRSMLIPQPQPLKSAISFAPDPADPTVWILAVRGLSPIEDVRIEGRYDLRTLLTPGTTIGDDTDRRLAARAVEVTAELDDRFADDFKALRGTVLTRDELDLLTTRLMTEDRIARVDEFRMDRGILTIPIVIRPTVKTLVGSGGIGYTPREGLTGGAGLTGQNLLGWNETTSFDLRGGADSQRGDFDFAVPLPSRWWNDERLTARVSFHGLYARASDTVLGQPRAATVTEEEHGVRLRPSVMFQPFAGKSATPAGPESPRPSPPLGLSERTAVGMDVEFGRRDVDLRGVVAPEGVPRDGVIAPLSVTVRASTGFAPRDTTGERWRGTDLRLESTYERSFSILGSHLPYRRWDVRASVEGLFWVFSETSDNDILLRYVHGYGTTNDDTPLFRFLRVGGESNVRGVETGEFIGRSLHFQQAEAGVGLCALQRLLVARTGTPASADGKPAPAGRECQAGGLDLSQAFIKTFVDHADVAERAVGARLERSTRSIVGVGVALELHDLPVGNQKLSLTIGYAYSPDSRRHSSGTVFTQVVMPFGLR